MRSPLFFLPKSEIYGTRQYVIKADGRRRRRRTRGGIVFEYSPGPFKTGSSLLPVYRRIGYTRFYLPLYIYIYTRKP